ncbi:MAG TPA: DUF5103 domain-containing protein [Cyclobacteriaceae bacterium]|jgi:hypothetical protein|nr:DUF5103 domain-containing protein [Cyclobacteriaceae bacterium]
MKVNFKYLCIVAIVQAIPNNLFAQKELSFSDKIYEQQIKTVQLYPNLGGTTDFLQPSSASIQQQNLLLEFDDLQDQRSNYYAKLIHCNYDWTKSQLMDLDFMDNYNEYPFTLYQLSSNTHVRYIHYQFQVPAVKLPGNYLLVVYRDDMNSLILTRRMMIYQNQIGLTKDDQFLGAGTLNREMQQFNFILDYGDIQILNPMETVHVNMRQNQRWDNAKFNLQPSFLRDDQSELEYKSLDDSRQFSGGNEFRFADFRSLTYPGQNTGRINKSARPYELYLAVDAPRGEGAYAQYKDLDGNYIIDNTDYGEPAITGNYLYVNFALKSEIQYDGDVYVIGKFNDYQRTDENKMHYNTSTHVYESQQFIKQGWYDYQYLVDSKNNSPLIIEGSHYETENVYEITIYNRPFKPNADLLIGYYLIPVNPR